MARLDRGASASHRPDVLLVGDLASVHVRRLAAALNGRGVHVTAAGFEGDPIAGVPMFRLGHRPPADDVRYLTAVPALARLVRRLRPTLVHAHFVSSFGLMTALAIRLAHPIGPRPPLVQTAWGTDLLVTARRSRAHAWLAIVSLRAAQLVTGDSLEIADQVHGLAPRVPFQRFVFGPSRALLTADREPRRVVLSTRRLDPDTRVDVVVGGFQIARDRSPVVMKDWQLVVAGTGRDSVSIRASASGRTDVQFAGQLGPEALRDLLLGSEVFVSIPRSDGASAALLEAMAAGSFPIVNDLPANREWVDDEVGIVVARDPDSQAIADAIETACQHRPNIGAPRSRVAAVIWEDEIDRLVDTYRTMGRADRRSVET